MKKYNVAVLGATGMVGGKLLEILSERTFPINDLFLFSGKNGAGKKIYAFDRLNTVMETTESNISKNRYDFAFFCAGGKASLQFAELFVSRGAVVIDNSSAFRRDPKVPLVVPEVNGIAATFHEGIISNPNCSTIQSVVALNPVYKKYGMRRVVYSTYQAVSGAGQRGYTALEKGERCAPYFFGSPILGNIIPQIGGYLPNGYTEEEDKMIFETKKIFNDFSMGVTATAVRVPVFFGHSVSINAELENNYDLGEIVRLFEDCPYIKIMQDEENSIFPTPINAADTDTVYVGRIRRDDSRHNALNMWVVADNIRKGAAANAVDIAEYLIATDN